MLFLAKSSFSGLQSSFWHVWLLPQTPPDSADEGAVEQSSFLLSDWLWMWQHDRNPIYWPVLAVCTAVETDSISISMHRSASDPHGVSVHVLFKQSVVVLLFVICDGGQSQQLIKRFRRTAGSLATHVGWARSWVVWTRESMVCSSSAFWTRDDSGKRK